MFTPFLSFYVSCSMCVVCKKILLLNIYGIIILPNSYLLYVLCFLSLCTFLTINDYSFCFLTQITTKKCSLNPPSYEPYIIILSFLHTTWVWLPPYIHFTHQTSNSIKSSKQVTDHTNNTNKWVLTLPAVSNMFLLQNG